MLESLKRILDRLSNFDLASWLSSITISGYKVGLDTAQKDLKEEYPSEPDMEAIVRIGMRAHALSEKALAKAKGGMAHNADKLYQEMDATMKAGMSEKEALFQIQGRLRGLFTDSYQEWELERLARDQFLVATKEGRRAGWQKGGMKYRQWKIHLDNKTAADSKRMEGQITEIDKPYTDPLTGEKYMLAHIRPNDRCFSVGLWELPEDTIERDGLIYAKNSESDFVKGGKGSGVKGHTTEKEKKVRRKAKTQEDAKKEISKIITLDGFINIAKNKWYEGDMKIFDKIFTDTIGFNEENSRDSDSKFSVPETTKENIKEMFLINQDYLQKKYGETMTFYRGVNGDTYDKFKKLKKGEKAELETYNISSWSSDKSIAERFAKGSKKGVVIKVEVPTKQVLFHHETFDVHPEYKDEKEAVLGGNKFMGEVMSFHERKVVK